MSTKNSPLRELKRQADDMAKHLKTAERGEVPRKGSLMPYEPGTNTGHGHVWERPDGFKARCGGPPSCGPCRTDDRDRTSAYEGYRPSPSVQPIGLAESPINTEAVEMVTQLLERLRSGETIAVACVEVGKRRTVSIWAPPGPEGCYHALNSGCARLAYKMTKAWED